jgi:tetratricopeptide (TPR) repeat protein
MALSVEALFGRAIESFRAGRLEDAERRFAEVLRHDPKHVAALNLLGLLLTHLRRYPEAEPIFQSALAINSNSDATFYNFGIVLKALRRPGEALERFSQALAINPAVAETWNNRGTVFNDLKRYGDAISDFDKALALKPDYSEALCNKGKSCGMLGRYEEALAAYDAAIVLRPDLAEAWLGRGDAFVELGRHDEAFAAFDKTIALKPDLAGAWVGRGNAYNQLKRHDDAFAAYDAAIALRPDLAEAWLGRGNVFVELRRHDEALAAYDKALALNPDLAEAWVGRGKVFAEQTRHDEAIAAYDRAITLKSGLAEAWLGRGNVLVELRRHDEAFAAYDKALALKPDLAGAWLGRGNVFFGLNRDAEALECYEKSLALKQDFPEAQWNKALLKLSLGEYEEGWKLYTWGAKAKDYTSPGRRFTQPLWRNESEIGGKTILIHAEHGLGDTIQFSRYLDFLTDRQCRIIFEVQKPLVSLFKYPGRLCEAVAHGGLVPPFDLHCPLMSLPSVFDTRVETIPANVPYIQAPGDKRVEWAGRVGAASKPRIGLVWSGNPRHRSDRSRSIPLSAIAAIVNDDFEWYRLQKDIREADSRTLNALPAVKDFSDLFEDFSDTAALIDTLDLVISIDTAIAHLAGAMAKPVWILLPFHPDFRWLRDRADSPWYPTARLYRQTRDGDWADVLERVAADLQNAFALKKSVTETMGD